MRNEENAPVELVHGRQPLITGPGGSYPWCFRFYFIYLSLELLSVFTHFFVYFLFFWPHHVACGTLVP